jgi:tetratricopeptide (TPR) repeat protein
VLLDDERAMDIALRMGLPDIERLLEAAGGEATPPPWLALLNGVGDGDVSSMQQAIHYLQTREPNNELIAALQHRLVEDPSVVLPLTRDYGHVRKILCGYPAADDDTLSIERRAAALQGAYPNAVERGISYDFNMCQRALEGARTEPRPMIPERPTPEQRPALLALAAELFQQSSGPDEQRSEADKIVTRLVAFGPDDVDARLLAARIEIAKGESMAGRSNNAQDLMDRLKIAARHLESALRIDPDFDEALALYVQLLSREGHAGISEVVSLAAGPNLTEPALQ